MIRRLFMIWVLGITTFEAESWLENKFGHSKLAMVVTAIAGLAMRVFMIAKIIEMIYGW